MGRTENSIVIVISPLFVHSSVHDEIPNELKTDLHFRHGDGDGVGLDGQSDALLHSGGEALRLLGSIAPVLPGTSGERKKTHTPRF